MILLAFHLRLQPNAVQNSSLAFLFSTFFSLKRRKSLRWAKLIHSSRMVVWSEAFSPFVVLRELNA